MPNVTPDVGTWAVVNLCTISEGAVSGYVPSLLWLGCFAPRYHYGALHHSDILDGGLKSAYCPAATSNSLFQVASLLNV